MHSNLSDCETARDEVLDLELLNDVENQGEPTPDNRPLDIAYSIEDVPPWYLCILLGFQHYLTMFGSTIAVPLILSPALCIGDDNLAKSKLISTIFFVSGICTLLQTIFGVRLPIVQGATFSFLAPTFAILALPQWQCPAPGNTTSGLNGTQNFTGEPVNNDEVWMSRVREIQGAIMVSAIFQVFLGFSGIVGLLMRFIGPLVIAPTITLVGLALFGAAADFAGRHWGIAALTIALITLFSQYLRNVNLPCCGYSRDLGCHRNAASFALFKLFPVIMSMIIAWIFCAILTVANVPYFTARTDERIGVLQQAPWFRFPYPGQWGMPTVSVAGVFGMLSGVLSSMIESIGDYYACARLSGAPPPPTHAINRGIGMEGIGCILAGAWGSGNGTTSYSENIGAIGITKVASRRVVQAGAVLAILLGMLGKFGALFTTIPDPIVGGMFCVMFGMITAIGVSNLQFVDLNSSRNLFVFGFSVLMGLAVPYWLNNNPDKIKTNVRELDQIITVLLTTSMFVGGFFAFILDNTIPGTAEERGLLHWNREASGDTEMTLEQRKALKVYDLPFGMGLIRRSNCTRFVPFCPTFLQPPITEQQGEGVSTDNDTTQTTSF
ncbi:PREDICTED: solute carrier family 23 member 2-like isoform X1 [Branchiostoma belcheri]|uniref:Solute carrier family 23 member 2-like isoform X1 n=1 Tax=Branchiostoma belcheri TaxID=7741 RepID=A0A6P5A379_BRABE|nr:PREDICTED: solute carrier family 23 member 2-like isoform X1 [Branchiostoma belcheri]